VVPSRPSSRGPVQKTAAVAVKSALGIGHDPEIGPVANVDGESEVNGCLFSRLASGEARVAMHPFSLDNFGGWLSPNFLSMVEHASTHRCFLLHSTRIGGSTRFGTSGDQNSWPASTEIGGCHGSFEFRSVDMIVGPCHVLVAWSHHSRTCRNHFFFG
jgi:hypothetical protein